MGWVCLTSVYIMKLDAYNVDDILCVCVCLCRVVIEFVSALLNENMIKLLLVVVHMGIKGSFVIGHHL